MFLADRRSSSISRHNQNWQRTKSLNSGMVFVSNQTIMKVRLVRFAVCCRQRAQRRKCGDACDMVRAFGSARDETQEGQTGTFYTNNAYMS